MKQIAQLSGGQSYKATNMEELNKSYDSVLQQVGYRGVPGSGGEPEPARMMGTDVSGGGTR